MAAIEPKDFDEPFHQALERELKNKIKQWCAKRSEQLVQEFSTDLRDRLLELSAKASMEIFNMVEFFYDKNRLVIQVKLPEKQAEEAREG